MKIRTWVGVVAACLLSAPVQAQTPTLDQLLDHATSDIAAAKVLMVPLVAPPIFVPVGANLSDVIANAPVGARIELSPAGTFLGPVTLKDGKTLTTSGFDPVNPVRATVSCPQDQTAIRVDGLAVIRGVLAQCNGNDIIYLTANADVLIEYTRVVGSGSAKNGITLNGKGIIRKNDIDQIYRAGQESHGILHTSGGPFVIDDNDIRAAGINFLSGGDRVMDEAAMPHDVTFTNNRIEKRLEWRAFNYVAKNFVELKMMRNFAAHNNTYRNSWQQGQPEGWCLSIGVRNQYGDNPFATVKNVVMEDEVFTGCGGFLSVLGQDYTYPSQITTNVRLSRITVNDLSKTTWGGSGKVFFIQGGPIDLVIEDLLVVKGAGTLNSTITFSRPLEKSTGFIARRWDVPEGTYTIQHDGTGTALPRGAAVLQEFLPGYIWENITIRRTSTPGATVVYPTGTNLIIQ